MNMFIRAPEAAREQRVERKGRRNTALMLGSIAGAALFVAGTMRLETAVAERQLPAEKAVELAERAEFEDVELVDTNRWFVSSRGCELSEMVQYEMTAILDDEEVHLLACNGVSTAVRLAQID